MKAKEFLVTVLAIALLLAFGACQHSRAGGASPAAPAGSGGTAATAAAE